MDRKTPLDVDLKAPVRKSYSSFELAKRRRGILRASAMFVAGYSTLHRGIIPCVLKFFPLTNSAYTKIDPWFLVPIGFVYFSSESRRDGFVTSWFAGMGIAQGFVEALDFIFFAKKLGWLGISHMVSALPFVLIAIIYLSGNFLGKKPWIALGGAFSVLVLRLL